MPGICLICDPKGALQCYSKHDILPQTPLLEACIGGKTKSVKYLVEHGARVDLCDQVRASGLRCGQGASASCVLWVPQAGRSPLHVAAVTGDIDIIEVLLGAGADINAPDNVSSAAVLQVTFR